MHAFCAEKQYIQTMAPHIPSSSSPPQAAPKEYLCGP